MRRGLASVTLIELARETQHFVSSLTYGYNVLLPYPNVDAHSPATPDPQIV